MGAPELPPVKVLFDATRLIARRFSAPSGIDRVDLAYAQALAAAPGFDLRLLGFDLLGPRLLERRAAAQLIEETARRWRAGAGSTGEAYMRLREWLLAPPRTPRPRFGSGKAGSGPLLPSLLRRPGDGLRLRRMLRAGPPAIYLNTSHGRLFRRRVPRWLARERLGGVFFVHDLIPLEYPEFNRPEEPARHLARLRTVGAHAREVLVNSAATRAALEHHYLSRQMPVPRICVAPLGVEGRFTDHGEAAPLRPEVPYFVVLGTIEPRKNHQLLLQLWRRWIAEGGAVARLVIIGRRGWENQGVFNTLDRVEALASHVVECGGLNDAEVGAVLRGAAALLSPSFAEGYGLPVAEALSAGTPVLASDIAAHREVGGDCAEYLDPLDGSGWLKALRDYAAPASPRRALHQARLHAYRPPRWDEHFPPVFERLRAAALVS